MKGHRQLSALKKKSVTDSPFAFLESSGLASISVLCRKLCGSREARTVTPKCLRWALTGFLWITPFLFLPPKHCLLEVWRGGFSRLYRCWPPCLWLEHMCCVSANISPFEPHRELESRVDHNRSNLCFDQSTGLPAGAPNSLRALSFIRVLLSYLKTS